MSNYPEHQEQGALPDTTALPQWAGTTRYIASVGLVIAGIVGLMLLFPVMRVLFIAFVISFLMYIPSRWLNTRLGMSFPLAVMLLYLVAIVVLFVLLFVGVPALIREINNLWLALGNAWAQFIVALENYQPGDVVFTIGTFQVDFDPLIQSLQSFILPPEETSQPVLVDPLSLQALVEGVLNVAGGAVRVVTSLLGSVAGFLAAFFLAFFISFLMLIDLNRSSGFLFGWIPPVYRRETRILLGRVDRVWLSFFKGQVTIGALLGTMSYIQFVLMGVPGALPLALQNAFISLIPNIGGLLSALPVAFVTLLGGSTVFTEMSNITFTLLVIGIMTVYSQLVYNFVAPLIVGKSVNLPVVVVIVGLVIGFGLAGVLGALLVIPVMGTLRILLGYVLAKVALRDPFPDADKDDLTAHGFISQIFSKNGGNAATELAVETPPAGAA